MARIEGAVLQRHQAAHEADDPAQESGGEGDGAQGEAFGGQQPYPVGHAQEGGGRAAGGVLARHREHRQCRHHQSGAVEFGDDGRSGG
ncbi:hypothetical protein [Streptomyces sp. SID1143]|uniref:hypothetical protein n=1 Tax=Streptomyces sp. SID1143 TaxID=3425889 RepID=UPI0040575C45